MALSETAEPLHEGNMPRRYGIRKKGSEEGVGLVQKLSAGDES